MDNIVKEDLDSALQELDKKQLKKFKWMLNFIDYNGKPNIPKSSLDKADEQDVVELLIQYYVEDALEVCIKVLKKCNINDIAKKLEETQQKDVDGQPLPDSSDYRNYVKNKFATMKDPNAVLGEYVSLNQRYSKLIILDYQPSKEEREHEILAMGRKHLEIISKRAESATSIETLFNPDKYGLIPQVVVLQGAAGIGKTIMAKKIILDWASQLLYQDKFNYVFYICCRNMNVHAESQISIADIVSEEWLQCHKSKNVIQNILKNEDKLLFIIDGFDEFRYSFDLSENYFCIDPWKKEPVRIILSSLFQKKVLPKSSLIITTRPTALEKFQCLERTRNVEILGFSTKDREEYFYKFFENKDQATQALRYVKQNDTLFTMCVIPLVSWIICTVMKQELEKGKDLQKTPYTLTAIYILYFSSLLKFHHKESKQNVQSNMKGLCSLAAEGVWEQKTLFMEEEVKKNLNQGDSLPLFLNQRIFKREIDRIQTFSFIHLSFQEFFAALFYVLEEGIEQHSENWNKNLQTLLERQKSLRPDFAVGFRFLFGFLNEERMRELRKEFGWEISPKNKEFLLNWVENNIKKKRHNVQLQKEMLSYLYETQEDNFIKNAICSITEIDYQSNSDMELMILVYCIQHCQNLKYLFVEGSTFLDRAGTELCLPEDEEWSLDERYMEDFFKALTKLRNLSILRFSGWFFTESCSRYLAEILTKNQRLKELQLFLKDTNETAVELLCDGLQHQDCKVETLGFSGWSFTESCSRHLAEVFKKNQRLKELQLFLKDTNERAMEVLCDGLQHQDCKVETLALCEMMANEFTMRPLIEVFRKNQTLRTLCLSTKNPDEGAIEILCEGLKHQQCRLEMLQLDVEITKESTMRLLTEVFRENQSLRNLFLSLKNPEERAMEVLCEGLKHPQCTLQMLKLDVEITKESTMRLLTQVFKENQSLRNLCFYFNNPDEGAMQILCEGLKHPQCTIEGLEVDGEIAKESTMRHITEVFRENQTLTNLSLSLKNPDERVMEVLCEGLKHPQCTLQILRLRGEMVKESIMRPLTEIFKENQTLRNLHLSFKYPDEGAMEFLCEGLKHPQCTIEGLYLVGEIAEESTMRPLTDALRENQTLRTLSLSPKNPNERAMEILCEGLKHPQCTIQLLQLGGEITKESTMRHITEVFRENQTLRNLCLSLKNPEERAMEVLCEGLRHPQCTLRMLQLDGEITKESTMRPLTEVFRENQTLEELSLSLKNSDEGTMKILCEGLKHPQCTIEILELGEEMAKESTMRHLTEVFKENQSLRYLRLSFKNPDESAMEILCKGLKHPQSTIETLELDKQITKESTMRLLTEVFRENQTLINLSLSLKNPDGRAMEVLCEGLKHPQCTLHKLHLGGDMAKESIMKLLTQVFRENQRLTQLRLSFKNPDKGAMEILYEGLKHPQCTIQLLELNGEIGKESIMRPLTEVFMENQTLKNLRLSLQNPDERAMEVLCEGLNHPQCTIEIIDFGGEIAKESTVRPLTEVFRKNQRLRNLCLSFSNADERTMNILCEGLKDPQCTIETLCLGREIAKESTMRPLTVVFRGNQRLRTLFLCLKNPDERAMEILCEGLKHPQCSLEMLWVCEDVAKESTMRFLTKVFMENQRLRNLSLFLKNLQQGAMKILFEGLKHPQCTIQMLQLNGICIIQNGKWN